MRRVISIGLAAALLLAIAPARMGVLQRLPWSAGEAASSTLTCSVKPSCGGSEVAVFRMSGLANAHAGTAGGSTYPNVVCCSGPAGLGTSCAGSYDTVLRLWAADNAHVAESDLAYTTEVCLSADAGVNCQYGSSCGSGYACLATISNTTNAHVADCDGSDDYPTKVCCAEGAPPPPVGGIAELPEVAPQGAQPSGAPPGGSGWSAGGYAALASGLAAAAFAIVAAAWYLRRRWVR
jgi:hypothetical protein